MVKAVKGTLVKCDASIKAILVDIDNKRRNEFIIEDLDDEHILVKDTKISELKHLLHSKLREVLKEPDSDDDSE